MIALVIPIHIYPIDVQGNLKADQKTKMYQITLKWMKSLYKNCILIVCGHGENPGNKFDGLADYVLWSDSYTLPDKHGLFPNNPAQYKIVSMGCKKALELGCSHIIKVRGDGILFRSDIVLDDIKSNSKKLWITQQTSFTKKMLGDCYMYGPAKLVSNIWCGNRKVLYPKDGLINTGMAFLESVNMKNWNKALLKHCKFRDISELEIYDMRWNFHDHINNFSNGFFIGNQNLLWGAKNKWITYKNFQINKFDRDIFFTKKLFNSILFRISYKFIPDQFKFKFFKTLKLII